MLIIQETAMEIYCLGICYIFFDVENNQIFWYRSS